MFLFLPIFGQRTNGMVQSVSLLHLTEISSWLKIAYYILLAGIIVCGILTFVLKKGSKSNSVKALQMLLNGNGYSCGLVDGDFGTGTHDAVIKFQKAKKLDADGIVGVQTWGKLLK